MTRAPATPRWLARHPTFEPRTGAPLHAQIEHWLTGVIGAGGLVPGDRLPREADLAATLGVSRMTLRQALATLEAGGILERKTGRTGGTFVTEPRIECDLTGLAGFTEQMRRANVRAGARIVSAAKVPAPADVARALSITAGKNVYEVIRVRTAHREPLALERAYIPVKPFPRLLDYRLTGSIYDLMSSTYGHTPHIANEALEPVVATHEQAKLLKIPVGTPLMLIERTTYTAAGLAVEFARDLFRSDRIRISLQTGFGAADRGAHVIDIV